MWLDRISVFGSGICRKLFFKQILWRWRRYKERHSFVSFFILVKGQLAERSIKRKALKISRVFGVFCYFQEKNYRFNLFLGERNRRYDQNAWYDFSVWREAFYAGKKIWTKGWRFLSDHSQAPSGHWIIGGYIPRCLHRNMLNDTVEKW